MICFWKLIIKYFDLNCLPFQWIWFSAADDDDDEEQTKMKLNAKCNKKEECIHKNIISIKSQWKNNNFACFITLQYVYPFQLMQSALFGLVGWPTGQSSIFFWVYVFRIGRLFLIDFPFICRFNWSECHQTILICCCSYCDVVQLMQIDLNWFFTIIFTSIYKVKYRRWHAQIVLPW